MAEWQWLSVGIVSVLEQPAMIRRISYDESPYLWTKINLRYTVIFHCKLYVETASSDCILYLKHGWSIRGFLRSVEMIVIDVCIYLLWIVYCRATEKAKKRENNVHKKPTWNTGRAIREDTISRYLYARRSRHKNKPPWIESTGKISEYKQSWIEGRNFEISYPSADWRTFQRDLIDCLFVQKATFRHNLIFGVFFLPLSSIIVTMI